MVALWHDRGYVIDGPVGPGELRREHLPLRAAVWPDGSVVWGTGDEDSGGRPYRTAHVSPSDVLALASRVRAVIEVLPSERRANTAPDAGYDELAVDVDGEGSRLRWMQGGHPDPDALLGPVWRDARALVLAAVPAQGDPITIEGVDYEFVH